MVWARTDDGVRGFLVEKDTPGFTSSDVHHKISLRASITSELSFDEVRLPASAQLPEAHGLRATRLPDRGAVRDHQRRGRRGPGLPRQRLGLRQQPGPVRPADLGVPAHSAQTGRAGGDGDHHAAGGAPAGRAQGRPPDPAAPGQLRQVLQRASRPGGLPRGAQHPWRLRASPPSTRRCGTR